MKINLENNSADFQERILFLDHRLTGRIDLIDEDKVIQGGISISMHNRQVKSVHTAFRIAFKPHSKKTIYLRKFGHHILNTRIFLTDEVNFFKYESKKMDIYLIYAGAMLSLLIYNLFIAGFTRDKAYLIYCAYLFSVFGTVLSTQGVIDTVDIFVYKTLSHYLIVFSSLSIITAMLFTESFLKLDRIFPRFRYISIFYIILGLVPILFALTPWYDDGVWMLGNYIDVVISMGILILMGTGFFTLMKKNPMGSIYVLSWTFLFVGAIFYLASLHGVIGRNFIYNNGLLFGNIFEMLTLSLGLGYQITILNREKKEALEKVKIKDKLARLIRVLSHDIGNSLQVLNLFLARALKNAQSEKTIQSLEEAMVAAHNIKSILVHVREEQKLDDAKEHLECSMVPLNIVFDKLNLLFRDKIAEKEIELICDVPSQSVWAEETALINHVLSNIFSNMIKFAKVGDKISITFEEKNNHLEIEIFDSGEGFEDSILNDFRAGKFINSTLGTFAEKGTGFGLKIIQTYMNIFNPNGLELYNQNGAHYKLVFKIS